MTRSLEQLVLEMKKAAESAVFFRSELEKLAKQAENIRFGNITEINKALQQAGVTGEAAFVKLEKGASDALMQMNRLESSLKQIIQMEQAAQRSSSFRGPVYSPPATMGSRLPTVAPRPLALQAEQQAFVNQAGGIERANRMLAQYGMTVNNVTGAYKDLTSNITRFSLTSTDGIERATGHMDQFGNFTIQASRNASTLVANVQRNITKVIEWAAATAVVYTVMNQVLQAGGQLEDIEETMADIAIATGAAGDELQRYYDAALATANITGVDVTQTLEAQQGAYRAAAGSADRFRTANTLLTDSMILARLSGMDQAESLDILVAALRQSNRGLEEGSSLLDKWVRVTKNAGTSVETLAQATAITGDVAETAGLNIDQLNAIIATLDEKTTLSATEVGNALRTMFANVTAPEAISTLEEFGIAVRDVDGNMRSWLDITQNIVDLMNAGLLDDEQINRLANALGGGSRRGPQLIAVWQNFGRVQDLTSESMAASGDAADAMAIKTETLQASINELNNAFNELVVTLGFDGGFIEAMTTGLTVATDLVRTINDLAGSLDKGAVSITAAVVAFTALRRVMSSLQVQGPSVDQFGAPVPGTGSRFHNAAQYLTATPQFFSRQAATQGAVNAGLPVAAGQIYAGISSGESVDRIGAKVGASIAGAAIGNMILPGAGGLVGAVIADAFVSTALNRADAFREIALGESRTPAELESTISTALSGVLGPTTLVGPRMREQYSDVEIAQLIGRAVESGSFDQARANWPNPNVVRDIFSEAGFEGQDVELLTRIVGFLNPHQAELLAQAAEQYNAALEQQTDAMNQAAGIIQPSAVTQQISGLAQGPQGSALQQYFGQQQDTLYQQAILSGDTTGFTDKVNAMRQLETVTAAVAIATGDLSVSTEEYLALGELLLSVTDEEKSRIVTLSSSINDLRAQLEQLQAGGYNQIMANADEIRETNAEIERQTGLLNDALEISERSRTLREAREGYMGFTEAPTGETGQRQTREQLNFDEALQEALAAQDEYFRYLEETLGLDPEALRETVTEPLILAFADGFETVEGLAPEFQKFLLDMMKKTSEQMGDDLKFSFKDLRDVPASTIDSSAFRNRLQYYERLMQRFAPAGYEEEEQNFGLLLENNQQRTLNTTMTALNLTLEELVEVEKKQLEGVWNLPAGATAYVPITSMFYQQQRNNLSNLPPSSAPTANEIISQQTTTTTTGSTTTTPVPPVNINVEPQRTAVKIDGRVLAEIITSWQAEGISRRRRAGGGPQRNNIEVI